MSGRTMCMLVMIGLTVLVLLLNAQQTVELNLGLFRIRTRKAIAFFVFIALGAVIGVMLR
jgi:prepilin signal peptidase PulO-like enzyme (type II secretory pathway)